MSQNEINWVKCSVDILRGPWSVQSKMQFLSFSNLLYILRYSDLKPTLTASKTEGRISHKIDRILDDRDA